MSDRPYADFINDIKNSIQLIHGYDVVNETIVWRTVKSDIPALKNKIDRM